MVNNKQTDKQHEGQLDMRVFGLWGQPCLKHTLIDLHDYPEEGLGMSSRNSPCELEEEGEAC